MDNCEIPQTNADNKEIKELLEKSKTIAVVGMSDKPERDSYRVAKYLIDAGYKIIPVNPTKDSIMGLKCYPDVKSIDEKIDIVDIFRNIDAVPGVVDEAIEVKPVAIWLQLGLAHNASATKACNNDITFVQSKCLKIEHKKIFKK
jgi:predicted CoA-binding protein